ncbi:hypothetical protein C4L14_02175 [Enterobacter sp. RC4]|nr:hypothetical protein C4L14_02175 [Enterobacter sp. RC4]
MPLFFIIVVAIIVIAASFRFVQQRREKADNDAAPLMQKRVVVSNKREKPLNDRRSRGTDIVEIARIEAVIARSGDRLARRVLSDNEWAIWEAHQQPVRFLAKRFAVKEAAAKAFGTGIRNGLAFNQFEVFNDELGKPRLRLWGEALKLAEKLGVAHMHVTIADERHYASATVIIES